MGETTRRIGVGGVSACWRVEPRADILARRMGAGKPECDLVRFVVFGREMGVPGEFACGERLDSPDIKPDG